MSDNQSNANSDCDAKVAAIFRELAGVHSSKLTIAVPAAQALAQQALSEVFGPHEAADIAFHLTDWASDAAFIVAFTLFPERFSPEEIRDGIEGFLIHAPDHVAAAAKLHGYPVSDTFEVGALINASNKSTGNV